MPGPNAHRNKTPTRPLVRTSFERWAQGTGSPFELLLPDARWTIVGASPLSRMYHGVRSFLDEVIRPYQCEDAHAAGANRPRDLRRRQHGDHAFRCDCDRGGWPALPKTPTAGISSYAMEK